MKFEKEVLMELIYGGDYGNEYVLIENKLKDHSRWYLDFELIFKYENKFYRSIYKTGATEDVDVLPYEDEGEFIECDEVVECDVITTVYRKIK